MRFQRLGVASHKARAGTVPAVDRTETGGKKQSTVRVSMDDTWNRGGILFMQGVFTLSWRSEGLKDGGDYTLA